MEAHTMAKLRVLGAVVLAVALGHAGLTQAAPAGIAFGQGGVGGVCLSTQQDSGSLPRSVFGGCGGADSAALFHAFVNGDGSIAASAQIDMTNVLGPLSVSVQAVAGYVDNLTLSGGSGLHLAWSIGGLATETGDNDIRNNFVGFRTRSGDVFTGLQASGRVGNTIFFDDFFTFDRVASGGGTILLEPELKISLNEVIPFGLTGTVHDLYDLTHTVHLVEAEVLDADGHVVTNGRIISALGIDYLGLGGPGSTAAPAPSTGLLVAAALFAVTVFRKGRKHRHGGHSSGGASHC